PYSITATDDPNIMLFTDRLSDAQGLGIVRYQPGGFSQTEYISLVGFGNSTNRRGQQVFGVSNAVGVVYLPANALQSVIGRPHPAYIFITGYNKFVPGDPKHDPSLASVVTYPGLTRLIANVDPNSPLASIRVQDVYPVAAGGNVGIIRLGS